jgi:hypothetical protein
MAWHRGMTMCWIKPGCRQVERSWQNQRHHIHRNLSFAERKLILGVGRPDRQPQDEFLFALSKKFLGDTKSPHEAALKVAQTGA